MVEVRPSFAKNIPLPKAAQILVKTRIWVVFTGVSGGAPAGSIYIDLKEDSVFWPRFTVLGSQLQFSFLKSED
jgi:hypothetical protein